MARQGNHRQRGSQHLLSSSPQVITTAATTTTMNTTSIKTNVSLRQKSHLSRLQNGRGFLPQDADNLRNIQRMVGKKCRSATSYLQVQVIQVQKIRHNYHRNVTSHIQIRKTVAEWLANGSGEVMVLTTRTTAS